MLASNNSTKNLMKPSRPMQMSKVIQLDKAIQLDTILTPTLYPHNHSYSGSY